MFKGSLVALITPMRADGSVDEEAHADFVDWQIKEGIPVGPPAKAPPSPTTNTSAWWKSPSNDRLAASEPERLGDGVDLLDQLRHSRPHRRMPLKQPPNRPVWRSTGPSEIEDAFHDIWH